MLEPERPGEVAGAVEGQSGREQDPRGPRLPDRDGAQHDDRGDEHVHGRGRPGADGLVYRGAAHAEEDVDRRGGDGQKQQRKRGSQSDPQPRGELITRVPMSKTGRHCPGYSAGAAESLGVAWSSAGWAMRGEGLGGASRQARWSSARGASWARADVSCIFVDMDSPCHQLIRSRA